MSRFRRLAALAAGVLLGLLVAPQTLAEASPEKDLPTDAAALEWLAGHWVGTVEGMGGVERFEAQYTSPQGGVVLGTSKSFGAGERLLWFEFERFQAKDGVLSVTPYPNGRASVSFQLSSYDAEAKKAVFTNPEHDFPTEISYQRIADDRVQFLVSGPSKEGGRSVWTFNLSRQP